MRLAGCGRLVRRQAVDVNLEQQIDLLVVQRSVRPDVLDRAEELPDRRTKTEFLVDLSNEGRFGAFAVFDVPARKERIGGARLMGDQHLAIDNQDTPNQVVKRHRSMHGGECTKGTRPYAT